ncbi:hypothetical protein K505DRAFT_44304 [Melanomma pulvis-pyrius CBS 109.77]|uniref:F-box domain-containing protein n=1 Tax=Melanomma pulvis-pyrius CBS 109.77 TaxID=1314802 RepID=A0A6A6XTH9_9PLEO|nr:hypothetical protein K505DRAFT_44304 [Melanomma pulvis-pyrius CBS 109.77]
MSRARNRSKASFLDLPAEIRNNIYSRVLICEGYVRVMPQAPTKVAALVLLRTCKQIHDEAASIFYGANSFYVSTRKDIRHVPGKKEMFPDLGGLCTVHNGLSQAGGLIFPAPRYHVYLTRLTIDAKLALVTGPRSGSRPPLDAFELAGHDSQRLFEELDTRLIDVYTRMRMLWEEKERRWEGKLVTVEQDGPDKVVMSISMSFFEDEAEEIATRGMWKSVAGT